MNSDCVECDRMAIAYWGFYAYCNQCLLTQKAKNPLAHMCVECGVQQPANVSWLRVSPCQSCQRRRRDYMREAGA